MKRNLETLNAAAKAQARVIMLVSDVRAFVTKAESDRRESTTSAAIADGWTQAEIESAAYRVLS